MSALRRRVWKRVCPCGEGLPSWGSGMLACCGIVPIRVLYLDVLCQVFINYGPIPNNRLLRIYGFVIPGNPNDSYDLVLAAVLRLARKEAEGLLAAAESGNGIGRDSLVRCAKCEKISAQQLMLCWRCQSVMYCGRTCQVAHYKEHKAICQATASKNGY